MQRNSSNKSSSDESYDIAEEEEDAGRTSTSTMTFLEFRGQLQTCFRRNGLAILCCLFGLFWCALAVVMILLYANLITDIPFQPPQEQSQSPCDGIFCKFHGQCLITLDNVAKCSCIDVCTTEVEKVCGTNYMTFNNECELKRFSCHQKKRINIGYYGACKPDPCKEYRNCTYPSVCQLDNNRKPVCKCHEACPDDLRMVCGSNGKTYGNPCLLRREACLTNNQKLVRIKDGKCADRSSEDIVRPPSAETADNPCRQIRCPHGSCKLDRNNNPVCLCRERCVPVVKPVCATNRMDFDNVCELNRYACNNKLDIAVLRQGNCASASPCDKTVCPTNQFCVLNNNGEPKCQCKSCSDEVFYPICGTDRKTYNSRCHLQQINCQKRTNVREVHTGYCAGEGCGMFKKCPLYQFCEGTGSNAKCKCPTNKTCVNTKAEVCGNDFKKYHNECFLRAAACQQNKTMYIISLGECELCNGKTCQFGAECQNNECVCPKFCARGGQPVCANNGKKYINRCEMERAECLGRINLYEVLCKDQDSSTDIVPDTCSCSRYGARDPTCDSLTGNCRCKPGVGGTKCDRCLQGYYGLANRDFNGCRACNCNKFGSLREDCHQTTGACECRKHISGKHCDRCADGHMVSFNLCDEDDELAYFDGASCGEVQCEYGGYCAQKNNGVVCKCHSLPCLWDGQTLEQCGDDGKTYISNCHMQYQACKTQTPISRAYIGPCADSVTPRMDQPSSRSRKTTRHILNKVTSMMTIKSTARPPTESRFNGKIWDVCYDDSYCIAENSQCRLGICQCLDGYIPSLNDDHCTEVKTAKPLETVENITPCYNNPCRNGGTCELDESLGYRCLCSLGTSGSICTDDAAIMSPAFSGKSLLVVKETRETHDDIMFQIGLTTYNRDGIILFSSQYPNGTGDFASVTLNDGILEFRYDLGSGMAVLRSEHTLAANQIHKIIVNRIGRKGFLKVNDAPIINAESPGSLMSLDLNGPIYLGNLPQSAERITDRIGMAIGFAGCLSMFQAGKSDKQLYYNLGYPQFNGDILNGHDIQECGHNPCRSMPCKYGGNCLMADDITYQCVCKKGFNGSNCEIVLDPCLTSQCKEWSTCQLNKNGIAECVCPENMEGDFCEYEMLEKIFVPQFMGSSIIEVPMGEIGSNSLSIRVWFLTSKPNGVILYASQFINGMGDYLSLNIINRMVEFRFNMGGRTVEIRSGKIIRIDKWHEVLIQVIGKNGTLLVDNNDKWRYTNRSVGILTELNLSESSLFLGGFRSNLSIPNDSNIKYNLTGVIQRIYINGHQYDNLMEVAKDAINILKYIGPPCNVNPCLNGGICVPRLEEADCKCPTKYYGQRCEKKADSINRDLPVDFDGSTYLQYPNEVTIKQKAQRVNRYSVRFRTRNNDGLILFQNGRTNMLGDYLALAIVNGKVEFSYNLGKQTKTSLHIIRSLVRVDDGKWHQIVASRDERAGILKVDNELPVTAESEEGASQLDTNGMVWIGGKTEVPLGLPSEYHTGFTGCIREVLVDNKKLHLFNHRNGQSTSVIKFCQS